MRSDEMLNELEANFGLKDNHIKILRELQLSGALEADKLAKNTGVPLGRIYDFLNDLVEAKLVLKTATFPSVYSIDNLEQRVTEFMRYQTDVLIKKEQKLMDLFSEDKDIEQTTVINDREKLAFETMKLMAKSNEIKMIEKTETIPSIFYPLEEQDFIKLRNYFAKKTGDKGAIFRGGADRLRVMLHRADKESYISGKKVRFVMDKHSLDLYLNLISKLGNDRGKSILKKILSQLSSYSNVKVYVVKENLPISIMVLDNKIVLLRFAYMSTPLCILAQSKRMAEFYSSFFEELVARSKPAQKYLKEAIDIR